MTDVLDDPTVELDPYYIEHLNGEHGRLWERALAAPENYRQDEDGRIMASSAGRPWGKPGGRPGSASAPSGPRKAPAPAKKKPAAAGGAARTTKGQADYRPPLFLLSELGRIALNFAAGAMKSPALAADSATVQLYRPPVIEAANQMIIDDPAMSAGMERIFSGQVGGKLASALAVGVAFMPMLAQIAANHRKVPLTESTGPLLTHQQLFEAVGGAPGPEAGMMDLLSGGGRAGAGPERPAPEETATTGPVAEHHQEQSSPLHVPVGWPAAA